MRATDLVALRQSIDEIGVTYPVLVLPDGRIIDGHHRWQIAGSKAPVKVINIPEDDAFVMGVWLNLARRHIDGADLGAMHDQLRQNRELRKRIVQEARDQGMSQSEAGALVGMTRGGVAGMEARERERQSDAEGVRNVVKNISDTAVGRPPATAPDEDEEIASRLKQGESVSAIAAEKGVARSTIGRAAERARREPAPPKLKPKAAPKERTPKASSAVVLAPRGTDAQRWHYAVTSVGELLKGIRDQGGLSRLAAGWTPDQRERQAAALDALIDRLTECRDTIYASPEAANVVPFAARTEAR